jgi:hypothetical protein
MTINIAPITITSGSSSPWGSPKSWDSITIGGVTYGTALPSPPGQPPIGGKVRIRGAERFYKIDIKDPKGADGWSITYRGVRPKPFQIVFSIWTQLQYDYFTENMIPALLYSGAKGNVQPLVVQHPTLQNLAINAIFVEKIGSIEQVSDDLMFQCTVHVAEYLQPPPVNVTTTPVGASNTTGAAVNASPGVKLSPARAAQLNAIAKLRAQVNGIDPNTFVGPL